jgi:hypothetical protein
MRMVRTQVQNSQLSERGQIVVDASATLRRRVLEVYRDVAIIERFIRDIVNPSAPLVAQGGSRSPKEHGLSQIYQASDALSYLTIRTIMEVGVPTNNIIRVPTHPVMEEI